MDKSPPHTLLVVLFPFFFAGLWCFISLLLSVLGGWRRLAKEFPARGLPSGRLFRTQSGSVGWVSYQGCLTIASSPEGLCLSVMWPFRLGHPPLFLPWDAIHNAKAGRFFWARSVVFYVGFAGAVRLRLPRKVFEGRDLATQHGPLTHGSYTRRTWPIILVGLLFFIGACDFVIRNPKVWIAYHKFQMERAKNAQWEEPTTEVNGLVGRRLIPEQGAKFEYHRQCLIDLGVVRELRYKLQHILVPSAEYSHLWRQVESKGPPWIDIVSPWSTKSQPMELTVWCFAQDEAAWNALIAARDVADYKQRFMAEQAN